MQTFFVDYVGCSRRSLDCERAKNYLLGNGFTQTGSPKKADYSFIFTCGFHKSKEDDSIALIKKCKKNNGDLIVCGCLPIMNPERLKSVFDGRTITTKDMNTIDELFPHFRYKFKSSPDANWLFMNKNSEEISVLKKYRGLIHDLPKRIMRKLKYSLIGDKAAHEFEHILPDKKVFTIRIAEGCLGNCSYCNVRKAVGRLRSKPTQTIMEEVKKGLSKGIYRFNIISPDTGAYGLDMGADIISLINAILDENKKIVIEYLEDVKAIYICRYKKGFIDLVESGRIKKMVIPVESARKRILKLMRRPCDLESLQEIVANMKKKNHALRLASRVMIGFPTETEEDFQATIDYMKTSPFEEIDVHHYHETGKTDSSNIYPKVDHRIIRERAEMLKEELSDTMQINPDPT